jgi:MYXO-CTERM domain-containing protein
VLRVNVLAVMCLGLLASCGPAESKGSASGDSRERTSPAPTTVTQSVTVAEPHLALSPTSLDFGEQRVGTTSTARTVTVSNIGSAPLRITRVSINEGSPFTVSPSAAFELAAGASERLAVTFNPTTVETTPATLTLSTDDTTSPTASVSLSGTGVSSPELKLDRGSIFFGDVRVGSASAKVPVTVSNTGSTGVTLQNLSVEGPFSVLIPAGGTLPRAIPAGSSFTFDVIFKPSEQRGVTGAVALLSEPASSLRVSLSGNGTISAIHLSQTALDFGKQRVKATSGAQPVILTNTGSAELEITEFIFSHSAFAISSPLPLPSPGAPLRMAPGEQRALAVTFTPATLGVVSGKFYIISNAFTPATPLEVGGEGIDGQLSPTPGVVSFAGVEVGGSGAQQSVVLTNTGEHPLTITGVLQPEETSFTVSGLTPGLVLKPGEQWPFTVTFAPVKRGHLTGTFVIKSDASTSPAFNLALSGTGMAAAVELLPRDLHFGKSNVEVPTPQDVAIKNVGERDLYVSNISFTDAPPGAAGAALDFSAGGTELFPLVVKPGESKLVQLKFTPRRVGLRQARAIVHTNDRAAEVNLQGEGTSPNLALSSSSLDFGTVLVGKPSAPRALTITNTGTGPLILRARTSGSADAAAFILAPTLSITLQPGASTEVVVSLKPDAERSFSAQLVVESNDPDSPGVAVPMYGAGVYQQILLSESPLEFGQQLIHHTAGPRKVRITNSSDSNVTLTALAVEGAGASQFTLEGLPLSLVLAPGQGQEVGVSFTPLAEAEVNSTLKLTFRELPRPLEVALHGKGIPAVLSLKPSPLDFGGVRVGSGKREQQPLTLTNLSSAPIVLAAPEVMFQTGTPFSHDVANLQGRTLEPGMSLVMMVGYQPTAELLSETRLSFGTTQPNKPRSVEVQLKGRAMRQLLFVDPGSLNFGQVDVDKPTAPRVVTLINRSSLPQWVVVKLKDLEGSPFTVEAKALAEPIPPGGSASIKVAFQPLAEGEVQNEVQVWLQGDTAAEALIPVIGSGHINTKTGGCSSGSTEVGSAGLVALLMLVGLGSRRRRHTLIVPRVPEDYAVASPQR